MVEALGHCSLESNSPKVVRLCTRACAHACVRTCVRGSLSMCVCVGIGVARPDGRDLLRNAQTLSNIAGHSPNIFIGHWNGSQ